MRFAQKIVKCMNCKTALPSDRTTLCVHCESKEPEIYGKTVLQVRLSGCAVCSGTLRQVPGSKCYQDILDVWGHFVDVAMLSALRTLRTAKI